MTQPARFREADVKRATAGVTRAGLQIAKIEIDPSGKIVIIPGNADSQTRVPNEWQDLE